MEKLELKHLAAYFPHNTLVCETDEIEHTIQRLTPAYFIDIIENPLTTTVLILRPLSDLEDYFKPLIEADDEVREFLGNNFLYGFDIWIEELETLDYNFYPYAVFELLCKHHFDVFGLIEKGLAISIHDV
jgi:hypothetical protein